ncbi:hypothetical protein ACJRO7_027946 [Eucalyptus globulus]|uniref:Uncharacterized protein n=1 Tax=Eucalyptus globulus TaxID=34317 RepID=A0ABD3JTP3_EUCGL
MPKEDSTSPIEPSRPRLRSDDVELAHFAKPPPHRNQRRSSSKCFVYALAPIIILRAAFLGFTLTVRIKSPELRLHCVDVKSLEYSTVASFSLPQQRRWLGRPSFGTPTSGVRVLERHGWRAGARERARVTVKMEVRSSEVAADVDGSRSLASDVGSNIARARTPERAKMREPEILNLGKGRERRGVKKGEGLQRKDNLQKKTLPFVLLL